MANNEQEKINWMYDGIKGSTNREDYLLGKRIDKNFVMYSDVIKKDEDEDAKQRLFNKPSTSDEAAPLPLLMVRQEDPLAALKVNEAIRRQAILKNPQLKKRAEQLLKEEMEKKERRKEKKKERRELKKAKKEAKKSKKEKRRHRESS